MVQFWLLWSLIKTIVVADEIIWILAMDRSSVVICSCLIAFSCFSLMINGNTILCLPHERDALLAVKSQLHPSHLLHSWQGFNCCEWRGVECSSISSNVVKLRLANHVHSYYWGIVTSEVNSRLARDLFHLEQLEHPDLSFNYLSGVLPKGMFNETIFHIFCFKLLSLTLIWVDFFWFNM